MFILYIRTSIQSSITRTLVQRAQRSGDENVTLELNLRYNNRCSRLPLFDQKHHVREIIARWINPW